jgi:hypothetical protein
LCAAHADCRMCAPVLIRTVLLQRAVHIEGLPEPFIIAQTYSASRTSGTGSVLWPGTVVLAGYIASIQEKLRQGRAWGETRAIELGCGAAPITVRRCTHTRARARTHTFPSPFVPTCGLQARGSSPSCGG